MAALIVGPGTDEASQVGPLINADAVAKVDELVTDAVAARRPRRRRRRRGPSGPAVSTHPTVLVDVPPDAQILREEIFGPVAPIVTFTSEDEAIALANDTEFGLVATSTPATSPAACGSAAGSKRAWSASTAASCPTRRHRSAA